MLKSQSLTVVVDALPGIGAFRLGAFTLKHHQEYPDAPLSPFYIDLRMIQSFPDLLEETARVYGEIIRERELDFRRLVPVPTAAVPIASVMSVQLRKPMISPRLDAKTHGLVRGIDGVFEPGDVVLVVDDLVTTARSKLEVIEVLTANELTVWDVLVLLDREQGGWEELAAAGFNLHAAIGIRELLAHYVEKRRITTLAHHICKVYLGGGLSKGWEAEVEEGWDQIAA